MSLVETTSSIRVARQRKGLTAAQLGQRVKASKGAVSKWERGTTYPSPATAWEIKRVLGISLEQVYERARPEPAKAA